MSEAKTYIPVYSPDKYKLAEMLTAIKGASRTMAQFSEDCGLSASTLSRIANGKISKSLSSDVILTLYANRTEGCAVTLEQLYYANGYVEEHEASRRVNAFDARTERLRLQQEMKVEISNELFKRGVRIQRLPLPKKTPEELVDEIMCPIPKYQVCDLAINAEIGSHDTEWGFFFVPELAEPTDDVKDDMLFIRYLVRKYAIVFLGDAWDKDCTVNKRMSFVFRSYPYHHAFVESLKDAPLRSAFTSICLNCDNGGHIIEEGLGAKATELVTVLNGDLLPDDTITEDEIDWDE